MNVLEATLQSKRLPALTFVAVAALFLLMNRGSYESFFDGGDLQRLEQFSRHSVTEHLLAMVLPNPGPELDQPLGRLLFGSLSKVWRGSPKPYIVLTHILHFLNLGLLLALTLQM